MKCIDSSLKYFNAVYWYIDACCAQEETVTWRLLTQTVRDWLLLTVLIGIAFDAFLILCWCIIRILDIAVCQIRSVPISPPPTNSAPKCYSYGTHQHCRRVEGYRPYLTQYIHRDKASQQANSWHWCWYFFTSAWHQTYVNNIYPLLSMFTQLT